MTYSFTALCSQSSFKNLLAGIVIAVTKIKSKGNMLAKRRGRWVETCNDLYISGLIIIIIQLRMSIVYCQGAQFKLFLYLDWYTSAWKFTVNSSKNVC